MSNNMDSESLYAAALEKTWAELQQLTGTRETNEDTDNEGLQDQNDQKVGRNSIQLSSKNNASEQSPGPDAPGTLSSFPPTFTSHKRIPGTRFVVDGFRVAGPWSHSYFLTHFHSDHYQGITENWRKGVIFCSEITSRMVTQVLEVPEQFVVALPMNQEVEIDGCGVTLIDANHCPGAIQFLFRVPGEAEKRYVHCGDMRYCRTMTSNACLAPYVGADAVYLDTTYCNPRYVFPPQEESVNYVAATVAARMQQWRAEYETWQKKQPEGQKASSSGEAEGGEGCGAQEDGACEMRQNGAEVEGAEKSCSLVQGASPGVAQKGAAEDAQLKQGTSSGQGLPEKIEGGNSAAGEGGQSSPPTGEGVSLLERVLAQSVDSTDCPYPPLFIIATYVIGKEKILYAVAERCGCKIYVDARKIKIFRCLGLKDMSIFTTNPNRSNVHVVGWGFLGDAWPFFRANFTNMEQALAERGYQEAVGFVPTGWTYELKKKAFPTREKGRCKIHLVPYSEHSNYAELREYVSFLKPKQIIPTVGVDEKGMDGKAVAAMRKHFRNLVDETEGKRRFLRSFQRSGSGSKRPELELARDLIVDAPVTDAHMCQDPVGQEDACEDLTGQQDNSPEESGEDTEIDEEAQMKKDPDYVGSEGDPDSQELETERVRGMKADPGKQGLKVSGGGKHGKGIEILGGKKQEIEEVPAGRLMPVLSRRGKRKFSGEKGDVGLQKRQTLDIRVKPKEPVVKGTEEDAVAKKGEGVREKSELGEGSGEGLSWIQAHKQALQTANPTPKPEKEETKEQETKLVKEATEERAVRPKQIEATGNGEKVAQLRAILPGLSVQRAEVLLARAGGDVGGALTWFYDGGGDQEEAMGDVDDSGDKDEGAGADCRNENQTGVEVGTVEVEGEGVGDKYESTLDRERPAEDCATDVIQVAATGLGQGEASRLADEDGANLQSEDRKDRSPEASTSPKGEEAAKQAVGKLRSPPRTPTSGGKKKSGNQAAGQKRGAASRNGGGANKKGKMDRQQPSILSFFGGGKKEQAVVNGRRHSGLEENQEKKKAAEKGKEAEGGGVQTESDEAGGVNDREQVEQAGAGKEGSRSEGIGQVLAVLDGAISKEEAVALLDRAQGNVSRALDLFYSGQGTVREDGEGDVRALAEQDRVVARPSVEKATVGKKSQEEHRGLPLQDSNGGGEGGVSGVPVSTELEKKDGKFIGADHVDGPEGAGSVHAGPSLETGSVDEESVGKRGGGGSQEEGKDGKAASAGAVAERQLGGVVATGKVAASGSDRTAVTLPLAKYNPVGHACWKAGEGAPYLHLARTFEILEKERGRLKMADILCNMFRSLLALSPADILPAVYLSTNRIAPDFESVDMSIGGSTVGAAIAEATGTSKAQMRELYNSLGDLGDVALACKQRQATLMAPPPLRVAQVYGALRKISKETGPGCNNRKKNIVLGLLRACREKETQFVVRTLILNMRIGAMMKTVLPALAQAVVIHNSLPSDQPAGLAINGLKAKLQEASAAMVEAYNFCPNLDVLVPTLVEGGIEAVVAQGAVALGTPIKPMLAKITNGIPEVLKRFQGQAFTAEFKYDGQRAQIHLLPDGSVKIFSRNCDDNTGKFPDVIETVKHAAKGGCSSFIIDAELVAVDRGAGNKLMAFQTLSTRARGGEKTKIEVADVKIAVCVFAFDLMYVDGEALVKESFRERRKRMREAFPNHSDGHFEFAREVTVEEAESDAESEATSTLLQNFLQEAFSASCEGMMVKALDKDAGYAASKRSDSWLKVKKDYIEGLNDSLDLVPIGAWYGQGRKVGWFSPFLLACYDPEREEYQSVCRVMSGFTDVFYKETSQVFREQRLLDQKPPYYRTLEQPDVWFSPHDVWEIRGADLTVSPVHASAVGLVHPTRGISMRFPRMIKPRPDKKPEDASPPSYIADLFHKQTRKLDVGPANGKEKKSAPEDGVLAGGGGEKEESGEESGEEEDRRIGGSVPGLDD